MLTFLIMAGGSGERFWPLSTKYKPKQLLKIFNNQYSLLELAYQRVLPLTDKNHIFIATNELQYEALKQDLKEIDDSRIIIEPCFKDTASAIAYGTTIISKYYNNPTICVLASDHLIRDEENFRQVLLLAEQEANKHSIVTLGIKPEYPETGYGYIEVNAFKLNTPTQALGFKEKPNLEKATEYFNEGRYLWNSGIFIFSCDVIMEAFKLYSFNHYRVASFISNKVKENQGIQTAKEIKDLYALFEKKSIDYAVMEHAKNVVVIPSSFAWNDVGSFLAFEKLFKKDENNNVIKNSICISIDSFNNIIVSDKQYQSISLLGVENMIVAVTKDNILICRKDKNQDIKKIINKLNNI